MPQKNSLRIHLLVQDDEAGPIRSGGLMLNTPAGKVQMGKPGKFRAACDPEIRMDALNRGTGEPWGVRCADCFASEAFQKINRPKPGSEASKARQEVAIEDCLRPPCKDC